MFRVVVRLFWISLLFSNFAAPAYINRVHLEQLTPFPVELESPIRWRLTPTSGNSYDHLSGINIYLNEEIIGAWNPDCVSYLDKPSRAQISCEIGNGPILEFTFVPTREHFGQNIRIVFYPDIKSTYSGNGQILLNTTIKLIKQPKFLDIKVTLDREPDYVHLAPRDLNLAPPIFLDGSMAKVECTTDGALPPQPITFDIVCNNPPRAAVEQERQSKIQMGYPYEVSYNYFNFRSPPTDEELAERMAIGYAQSIMQESRIARSQDNLTLSATLPINSKAHDCSIYCRLMGKERQYRLTVYYQTTVAHILPLPTDGLMRVGSSMTCYADGFPEPSIVLSLRQPMHQLSRRPIIDPREYIVTTSPLPPLEQIVDTSDIAAATRIGLRPDEYTIRGPRFMLAYNATPGVELMLICTAGNALPNAIDFLGSNRTIATARFTVAAISYSSIGIVVGICTVILLCAIMVILLMVYLRRRQKYTSNAIRTRNSAANAAGVNGAKMAGHGKQGAVSTSVDYVAGTKRLGPPPSGHNLRAAVGEEWARRQSYFDPPVASSSSSSSGAPSVKDEPVVTPVLPTVVTTPTPSNATNSKKKTNRRLHELRSSLVGTTSMDMNQESPRRGLLARAPPPPLSPTAASNDNRESVEYAELSFNPSTLPPAGGCSPRKATVGFATIGRAGSAPKLKRGPAPGPSSASMQQLPHSHAQENEEGESNYTEIIGVLQPKAYTSQLVLKQQQEATQAILGMHSNSPSVLV